MDHDKFPKLRAYLRTLTVARQASFALECGTTVGYLRKFLSKGGGMDASTVARIVTNSGGQIPAAELRPDVNWDDLSRHIGVDAIVPEKLPVGRLSLRAKAATKVRRAAKLKVKARQKSSIKAKAAKAATQAAAGAA